MWQQYAVYPLKALGRSVCFFAVSNISSVIPRGELALRLHWNENELCSMAVKPSAVMICVFSDGCCGDMFSAVFGDAVREHTENTHRFWFVARWKKSWGAFNTDFVERECSKAVEILNMITDHKNLWKTTSNYYESLYSQLIASQNKEQIQICVVRGLENSSSAYSACESRCLGRDIWSQHRNVPIHLLVHISYLSHAYRPVRVARDRRLLSKYMGYFLLHFIQSCGCADFYHPFQSWFSVFSFYLTLHMWSDITVPANGIYFVHTHK